MGVDSRVKGIVWTNAYIAQATSGDNNQSCARLRNVCDSAHSMNHSAASVKTAMSNAALHHGSTLPYGIGAKKIVASNPMKIAQEKVVRRSRGSFVVTGVEEFGVTMSRLNQRDDILTDIKDHCKHKLEGSVQQYRHNASKMWIVATGITRKNLSRRIKSD